MIYLFASSIPGWATILSFHIHCAYHWAFFTTKNELDRGSLIATNGQHHTQGMTYHFAQEGSLIVFQLDIRLSEV